MGSRTAEFPFQDHPINQAKAALKKAGPGSGGLFAWEWEGKSSEKNGLKRLVVLGVHLQHAGGGRYTRMGREDFRKSGLEKKDDLSSWWSTGVP